MLRRPFGPTGVEVSVIGQGTWKLRDAARAEEALRVGLDLGMTHIDTAELYQQNSRSEDVVGRVLADRRDEIFLASKVLPTHARPRQVREACERSLKHLGTDVIDLYYYHWAADDVPIADTMGALADLVDDGKVRHLAVSNFDVHELEEAKAAVGPGRIAANQVLYHLGARGIESDVLPWCKRERVAVVGYSPFGSGQFPSPGSKGGKALAEVAAGLGKTPRQAALAFLARDPDVFLIPKAEAASHVRENAGGAFALPKDAVAEIDAAFPMKPGLSFL